MSVTIPRTSSFRPAEPGTGPAQPGQAPAPRVTVHTLAEKKRTGTPVACLTAYDYATARLVDDAGIDLLLVGDSLGMVVLGYDSTLPVTMEEMLHHTRAVRRAVRRAMVIADMPYGSYHASVEQGVANAVRFLKEAGAEGVKIEGGASRVPLVRALAAAETPVMGHIGLTPQSLHTMGGYKVQGKTVEAFDALLADALALEAAGCFAIVLEGVPRELAARITAALHIPTIGIGAGPDCDGQILVFHDLVNLTFAPAAKFVRRYADAGALIQDAISAYVGDVVNRSFPSDAESYHLPPATAQALAQAQEHAPETAFARRKA